MIGKQVRSILRLVSTAISFLIFSITCVHAEDESQAKQYSLFRPVPRSEMREMSADRPDATESPYTVDAGHFQLESSVIAYDRVSVNSAGTKSFSLGELGLKVGLLDHLDFHLFSTVYSKPEGLAEESVFGDITLRAKLNIQGNDGSGPAIALMPFFSIPQSGTEVKSVFGLILPVSFPLGKYSLGTMFVLSGADVGSPIKEYSATITAVIGRELSSAIGCYAELIAESSLTGDPDYFTAFSAGGTYAIGDHVQFDLGGVVGDADGINTTRVFIGFSTRM